MQDSDPQSLTEAMKKIYREVLLERPVQELLIDNLLAEKMGISVEEYRALWKEEDDEEDGLVSEVPMVSIPLDDPYFTTPSDAPFPTEREKELMRKMWNR